MNFEELERTWTRQLVVGAPISAEMVQHELVREVRHRSRRVRRIMGVAAFVLLTGWATVAVTHFTGIKPLDPIGLSYLLTGAAFNLAFFILAFRSLQRNRREAARMGESLLDAVRGSLSAVQWQIRDCLLLAYGGAAALAASVLFLLIKYGTGALPVQGLVAGLAIDLAFALGLALTLRHYHRHNLAPRHVELSAQLAELEHGREAA